jgi:hypothetical protein
MTMTQTTETTEAALPPKPPGLAWRIWDSDISYSFRHSPVTIVAAIVTLVLVGPLSSRRGLRPTIPSTPRAST